MPFSNVLVDLFDALDRFSPLSNRLVVSDNIFNVILNTNEPLSEYVARNLPEATNSAQHRFRGYHYHVEVFSQSQIVAVVYFLYDNAFTNNFSKADRFDMAFGYFFGEWLMVHQEHSTVTEEAQIETFNTRFVLYRKGWARKPSANRRRKIPDPTCGEEDWLYAEDSLFERIERRRIDVFGNGAPYLTKLLREDRSEEEEEQQREQDSDEEEEDPEERVVRRELERRDTPFSAEEADREFYWGGLGLGEEATRQEWEEAVDEVLENDRRRQRRLREEMEEGERRSEEARQRRLKREREDEEAREEYAKRYKM